jgi:hypothetical protein
VLQSRPAARRALGHPVVIASLERLAFLTLAKVDMLSGATNPADTFPDALSALVADTPPAIEGRGPVSTAISGWCSWCSCSGCREALSERKEAYRVKQPAGRTARNATSHLRELRVCTRARRPKKPLKFWSRSAERAVNTPSADAMWIPYCEQSAQRVC